MDFSILKSEEKIKALPNYLGLTPSKPDEKNKGFKHSTPAFCQEDNILKNDQMSFKEPIAESNNHKDIMSMGNTRFSSYSSKVPEGLGKIENENPLGERGSKLVCDNVIFKNENEFIFQNTCRICENETNEKRNWYIIP